MSPIGWRSRAAISKRAKPTAALRHSPSSPRQRVAGGKRAKQRDRGDRRLAILRDRNHGESVTERQVDPTVVDGAGQRLAPFTEAWRGTGAWTIRSSMSSI